MFNSSSPFNNSSLYLGAHDCYYLYCFSYEVDDGADVTVAYEVQPLTEPVQAGPSSQYYIKGLDPNLQVYSYYQ